MECLGLSLILLSSITAAVCRPQQHRSSLRGNHNNSTTPVAIEDATRVNITGKAGLLPIVSIGS